MRLKIIHTTEYTFDTPVVFGLQQVRKTPKSFRNQSVESWTTTVTGGRKELSFEDHHRNIVELIRLDPNTPSVRLTSEGVVHIEDTHGVVGWHEGLAPLWLYLRTTSLTRPGKGTRELMRAVPQGATLDRLHALSATILDRIPYETGVSHAGWTAEDAMSEGTGVCQDHAHVFLTCARLMGVPARYVSGYLMMNETQAQDATHAWAEAYVEDIGWVGFDVSNGISPDNRYVRVATGLDYGQAAPVSGSRLGGMGERLAVAVEVAQQ
jgi:transglutaminase-like putative cysteine protease